MTSANQDLPWATRAYQGVQATIENFPVPPSFVAIVAGAATGAIAGSATEQVVSSFAPHLATGAGLAMAAFGLGSMGLTVYQHLRRHAQDQLLSTVTGALADNKRDMHDAVKAGLASHLERLGKHDKGPGYLKALVGDNPDYYDGLRSVLVVAERSPALDRIASIAQNATLDDSDPDFVITNSVQPTNTGYQLSQSRHIAPGAYMRQANAEHDAGLVEESHGPSLRI